MRQQAFVMLKVAVDDGNYRSGRCQHAFDDCRREPPSVKTPYQSDAAVLYSDLADQFGRSICRTIIDEHNFPFYANQGGPYAWDQFGDVVAFVQNRDDNANIDGTKGNAKVKLAM
ncbi:hypothetical protein YGS_C1P0133 [Sphingobium sp. YG1]|nr:hypothetical protein YGS_C1P0133 [Sphingobium sp. YG1]